MVAAAAVATMLRAGVAWPGAALGCRGCSTAEPTAHVLYRAQQGRAETHTLGEPPVSGSDVFLGNENFPMIDLTMGILWTPK